MYVCWCEYVSMWSSVSWPCIRACVCVCVCVRTFVHTLNHFKFYLSLIWN